MEAILAQADLCCSEDRGRSAWPAEYKGYKIKGSEEFGGERLDSSVCHPGGSKIVELCSCQLLQQQILLIRPSAPPETGINSMVHQNVYKLTLDRVE